MGVVHEVPRVQARARHRLPRWAFVTGIVAASFLCIAVAWFATHWPFERDAVTKTLGGKLSAEVRIGKFRQTYFPHPGCVAEDVTLRRTHGPDEFPLITIHKLAMDGSYTGMFRSPKRLASIRADGVSIQMNPAGAVHRPDRAQSPQDQLAVDELVINNGVLDVMRSPSSNDAPLRFDVHRLTLRPLARNAASSFELAMHNVKPPGDLIARGAVGPWRSDHPEQIPVSGVYDFLHANLGVFQGLGGTLDSHGSYHGAIQRIEIRGGTDCPDFEANHSGHPVRLITRFQAAVNAITGDVELDEVEANFGHTEVTAHGGITGHHGKTTTLDMTVHDGRIEDLMLLFIKSPRSPITGAASFHARAILGPQNQNFLEKIIFEGGFGIDGARFTSATMQDDIDKLSKRARGDKSDDGLNAVLCDLKGRFLLRGGIARFSGLSFAAPDALIRMHGAYNLVNERVDLSGIMSMQASLSEATKGVKSFFLKALDPFFKRKRAGAVVPVKLTGTYGHAHFGVALAK